MAGGYALLATLAAALSLALRDGLPWQYETPWVPLSPTASHAASLGLGVGSAFILIAATRLASMRFAWARKLHEDLRPIARDLSAGQIALLACLSSLGEELLFRGLLTSLAGVVLSAIAFGVVHQIKGPSRWVWIAWASVVGLAFGAIFAATGSLLGPLVAHAVVNMRNLAYLRDHGGDGARDAS